MALSSDTRGFRAKVYGVALLCLFGLSPPYQSVAASDTAPNSEHAVPNISVADVTDQKHISHVVSSFQSQLSRLGFTSIVACDHVTQLRYQYESGRPGYSYGASCTISNGSHKLSVLICDDMMIGKFTLGGSERRTRDGIANFIEKNCPPGG